MIQVVRQFLHKERSMDMAQTTKNAIRKGFLDLLEQRLTLALACADEYLQDEVTHTGLVKIDAAAPTFSEPGNIEFWY